MASHTAPSYHHPRRETDSGAFFKVAAVLLGILVAVLSFFALMMWADARNTDEATDVAATALSSTGPAAAATGNAAHSTSHNTALPLDSFAGVVPDNAAELAEAHKATDAVLPAVPPGDLVKVHMTLKDMVVEVAPGVKYNTWAFDGHGAPGPVVHVREGQTVEMTLTNGGSIPHSIDFHAARIAPNVAFADVAPGESFTFRFKATRPGRLHVPLRDQAGARAHRERHVRRDRGRPGEAAAAGRPRVRPRRERVVPRQRRDRRAGQPRTWTKAHSMAPDWVTCNGYANQYVTHPLTAEARRDRPLLGRRRRPDARHRLPRRRHDPQPRLGERAT